MSAFAVYVKIKEWVLQQQVIVVTPNIRIFKNVTDKDKRET